jgi:hypothetical protein
MAVLIDDGIKFSSDTPRADLDARSSHERRYGADRFKGCAWPGAIRFAKRAGSCGLFQHLERCEITYSVSQTRDRSSNVGYSPQMRNAEVRNAISEEMLLKTASSI